MFAFTARVTCLRRLSKLPYDTTRHLFSFRMNNFTSPLTTKFQDVCRIQTLVVRLNPKPEVHSYYISKPTSSIFSQRHFSDVVADQPKDNRKTTSKVSRRAHKTPISSAELDPNKSTWYVHAHSTAEEYDLESLMTSLLKQGLYQQSAMPEDMHDVLHVSAKYQLGREPREVYFFREGSVVFWNVPEIERSSVLKFLKNYEEGAYNEDLILEENESMEYLYTDNKTRLTSGTILLNSEGSTDLEKYAFSNGMAQSVKLAIWEASLDNFIQSIEWITSSMKGNKELKLTRKEVFRKTGELFALRHVINLSSDLLDTPDFYWDRENLETLYLRTCNHLNIVNRTRVMNEKLNHCCELMELLRNHLSDKHHVRLEWMIIVLIMVEVLFECVHYVDRFMQ